MSGDQAEGRLPRVGESVPRATSDGGTPGTEEGRGYCRSARYTRIASLSSLFPPHTALQTSLLPSSLMTRTQPQAEVRMTPSVVA